MLLFGQEMINVIVTIVFALSVSFSSVLLGVLDQKLINEEIVML